MLVEQHNVWFTFGTKHGADSMPASKIGKSVPAMRLPQELHEVILNHLLPLYEDTLYSEKLYALIQCALVSREFSCIARPLIFSNVLISHKDVEDAAAQLQIERLEAAFKSNSSLPRLVHSFVLRITTTCQAIEFGVFRNPGLPFVLSKLTQLESLAFDLDSPIQHRIVDWFSLPLDLQAAIVGVFDANSRHLKRLRLCRFYLPLSTWIPKLQSLTHFIMGPTLWQWTDGHALTENCPVSRAAPATVEFEPIRHAPFFMMFARNFPGFFRNTTHATITARSPIHYDSNNQILRDVVRFLSEAGNTLETLTWSMQTQSFPAHSKFSLFYLNEKLG